MNYNLFLKSLLTGSLMLVVNFAILAQESMDSKAQEIYNEAITNKYNATYSASFVDDKPKEKWVKYYQKMNSDGTLWTRLETPSDFGDDIVTLSNNDGKFYLVGDYGVKNNYDVKIEEVVSSSAGIELPKDEFKMSESYYNQIPCYIITNSKELTEQYTNMYAAAYNRPVEEIIDSIPVIIESFIGKEDKFIYLTKAYNSSYKLLSKIEYSDVIINPDFDSSLFQVPESTQIKIANTSEEFSQFTYEAIVKSKEHLSSRSDNYKASSFSFNKAYTATKICLIVIVVLLLLILTVRFIKKRN